MIPSAGSILGPWANFYILTGSAAAGLTGLMFVVISLVTTAQKAQSQLGIATFSTPTVVHLSAALFFSGLVAMPWQSLTTAATVIGVLAFFGLVYALRIVYLAIRKRDHLTYSPDLEDRIWYGGLPIVAYVSICGGAYELCRAPGYAPFAIGAAVLVLIAVGIHNAWDIVTYMVVDKEDEAPKPEPPRSGNPADEERIGT